MAAQAKRYALNEENVLDISLDQFLIDICTGSVLNLEQATDIWKILGNKRKMWRAAEDANAFGYDEIYKRATMGYYEEGRFDEEFKLSYFEKELILKYREYQSQKESEINMNMLQNMMNNLEMLSKILHLVLIKDINSKA